MENLSKNKIEIFGTAIITTGHAAIIDNIFVGLGKTQYNMVNSLIINIGYYGIFYLFYITEKIEFTMDAIILMFGIGMVVHLIVSLIEEMCFLRNKEIKSSDTNP